MTAAFLIKQDKNLLGYVNAGLLLTSHGLKAIKEKNAVYQIFLRTRNAEYVQEQRIKRTAYCVKLKRTTVIPHFNEIALLKI